MSFTLTGAGHAGLQSGFGVIATELRQSPSLFLAARAVVAQENTLQDDPGNWFCLIEKSVGCRTQAVCPGGGDRRWRSHPLDIRAGAVTWGRPVHRIQLSVC